MLVVFFALEIGVIRPSQFGFFKWDEVVIGVEGSIIANGFLIALLGNPPQHLSIAGVIENFPDNAFNLFIKM